MSSMETCLVSFIREQKSSSWLTTSNAPRYFFNTETSQSTVEISMLLVGSSSISNCGAGSAKSTLANSALNLSPPERVLVNA